MSPLAIIGLIMVADLVLSALVVAFIHACEVANGADW